MRGRNEGKMSAYDAYRT